MSPKKIAEAKTTCDGLHRLIRKLNAAAVDMDKSGGSAYELTGLLASAHTCVNSLSTQLDELADHTHPVTDSDTVTTLHRATGNTTTDEEPETEELMENSFSARG